MQHDTIIKAEGIEQAGRPLVEYYYIQIGWTWSAMDFEL